MPKENSTYNSGDENQFQFELEGLMLIERQRQVVSKTGRCCDGDYYYVVTPNSINSWPDEVINQDFINETNRLFLEFLENTDKTLDD